MLDIPFWIYFVALGIMISAYMVIKTGRDEKRMEDEVIEKEGEIYMLRLEAERNEKEKANSSPGVE